MAANGDIYWSWVNINECHLLTEDYEEFADKDEADFMNKEGQLKYEVQMQLEYFQDQCVTVNDEIISLMKEGTVHQPEILEQVVRGFNIDCSDFSINTAANERFREPSLNMFS